MGGGIQCGHLRGSLSAFNRKPEHRCTHTKAISKLKNPLTMVDLGIVHYKNAEGSWICGTLWHLYNKVITIPTTILSSVIRASVEVLRPRTKACFFSALF